MKIDNFDQLDKYLKHFIPPARDFRGAYTLDRMHQIMKVLGNPQDSYKVVHVAGTSGKTSTAYFIANMLKLAGKKVGLTVSPHIDKINERIQIDLVPLPEQQFCAMFNQFIQTGILDLNPTYFELLVSFAFYVFAEQKVDYAVVEVGLGGLLDGTNVITRADKLSVITDIGLDHTEVLGSNIESIATQKAGIILDNSDVCMLEQPELIDSTIKNVADQHQARIHIAEQTYKESDLPTFQQRNYSLAKNAFEFLVDRDDLATPTDFETDAKKVYIPARMEIRKYKDKTIIFDGSHNAQKIEALTDAIEKSFKGKKIDVLVSFVQGKQGSLDSALTELRRISNKLCVTEFDISQDLHRKSIDAEEIAKIAKTVGFEDVLINKDPQNAFENLLSDSSDVLLVTGSFYLLNYIRPLVLGKL